MWPFRRPPNPQDVVDSNLGETKPQIDLNGVRLRRNRVVDVTGMIDDESATELIAKLLYLQSESTRLPIALKIDSPGGLVTASLAVVDTIQYVKVPVYTDATGMAVGTAALILACGTPGLRSIEPTARVGMAPVESPDGNWDELARTRSLLAEIFAKYTRQPVADCLQLLQKERSYTPEEAVWFGYADGIGSTYRLMS